MHVLHQVLTAEEVAALRDAMADATFVDGSATVGPALRDRKRTLQLDRAAPGADAETAAMDALIEAALLRHPVFTSVVMPRRFVAPLFSRYEPGMHYGLHVDRALMGSDRSVRTDVSLTIFLSAPGDYDGGELLIETPAGPAKIKLPAGDAIAYPATSLHQVLPVTRGQRWVAVTWVQSAVRDALDRQLLHDLNTLAELLHERAPLSPEAMLATKTYQNLVRKFSDG